MGDIHKNKFQPQQTHDVANETVTGQVDAENIASHLHNSNVHIMNKRRMDKQKKQ